MGRQRNPNLARLHYRRVAADFFEDFWRQRAILYDRKDAVCRPRRVGHLEIGRLRAGSRLRRSRVALIFNFGIHASPLPLRNAALRNALCPDSQPLRLHAQDFESGIQQQRQSQRTELSSPPPIALRAIRKAPSTGSTTCGFTSEPGASSLSSSRKTWRTSAA